MFRPLRRTKQALSEEECLQILKTAPRGVLAVHGEDGYPYAFPMDFVYHQGKVCFHSAKAGHKLDALAADDRVSFCVLGEGWKEPGDWAFYFKSVILFGRIQAIEDQEQALAAARALGEKYFPTSDMVEKEIQRDFDRATMLELTVEHMSGKRVHEN